MERAACRAEARERAGAGGVATLLPANVWNAHEKLLTHCVASRGAANSSFSWGLGTSGARLTTARRTESSSMDSLQRGDLAGLEPLLLLGLVAPTRETRNAQAHFS